MCCPLNAWSTDLCMCYRKHNHYLFHLLLNHSRCDSPLSLRGCFRGFCYFYCSFALFICIFIFMGISAKLPDRIFWVWSVAVAAVVVLFPVNHRPFLRFLFAKQWMHGAQLVFVSLLMRVSWLFVCLLSASVSGFVLSQCGAKPPSGIKKGNLELKSHIKCTITICRELCGRKN